MSISQAKVIFGSREINHPVAKIVAIILGLLIAAIVVSSVVFFVLPILGVVAGVVLFALAAVGLTLLALALPITKKIKNKDFSVNFSDNERDYNFSIDGDLALEAKSVTNLEVLLEHGKVKISESPTGEIICKSSKGVIGYLEEGSSLYLKGISKEEDLLEVLIPKHIYIMVKIGKGELDLREVPVSLKVQMGMGKIMAYSTLNDLHVQSGNAKVYAHSLIGEANLELGMGDVVLDVTPTGIDQRISIKSAKVKAKVIVPAGIPVHAKAEGLNVNIDSDVTLVDEAPLFLNMKAAVGNIEIKEKSNLIYLQ